MPLSERTRFGPYDLVAPLGAGGMGQVYRARDSKLNRDVALKILPDRFASDPERLTRFEREAKTLASLNHPHIAQIYGFEQADGAPALVMEFVDGEDLATRLARGPLPADEALRLAAQIVDALEAAHERGIVHRDLKPANIKVTPDGVVKILDFGLAKAAAPNQPLDENLPAFAVAATQVGVILGTAAYMAPEQARGKAVDRRADIWAFGCVLYEMLAGRQAFAAETITDTLAAVVSSEPDWGALPADTPPRLRALLRRCLEKEPRRRLREIGDAGILLDEPQAASRQVAPAMSPWRHRAGVLLGLLLLAASFAGGWWMKGPAPAVAVRGDILPGPTIAIGPRVSRDGQMVAFQTLVKGITQVGLARPQSAHWTVLTSDRSNGVVRDVAWASDNSAIYFDRYLDGPRGIYRVPVLGGDARLVVDDAMTPEPLPDGSLLLVRANEAGQRQLFRFRPDTGDIRALNALFTDTTVIPSVRAFADGREAVFLGRPADQPQAATHLYILDLTSNRTRPLAPGRALPTRRSLPLATTRDGREVLFAQPSGDRADIVALPRAGSGTSRVVLTLPAHPTKIDAGADDFIYSDLLRVFAELLVSAPSGTDPVRLRLPVMTNSPPAAPRPLPLADGRVLIPTWAADRVRVMAVTPDGTMSPFMDTAEETGPPMTVLGRDHVALIVGQRLAIVSISDGRIVRRLDALPSSIESLAGTPDGATLFFVAGGAAWQVAVAGGTPRRISAAQSLTLDRDGRSLLVTRQDASGVRLVRVPLDRRPEQEIPVRGDLRLATGDLFSDAVGPDGRIVVRVAANDFGFRPLGLLDPRSGQIARLWPEIDGDMFGAWNSDGRVAAVAMLTFSDLWRFSTTRQAGSSVEEEE